MNDVVAETAVVFLGVSSLAGTGIIGSQLLRRRRSRAAPAPESTRAAADTSPVALGTTTAAPIGVVTLTCRECGSTKLHKRGTAHTRRRGMVQRYACRSCGSWLSVPLNGQAVGRPA